MRIALEDLVGNNLNKLFNREVTSVVDSETNDFMRSRSYLSVDVIRSRVGSFVCLDDPQKKGSDQESDRFYGVWNMNVVKPPRLWQSHACLRH